VSTSVAELCSRARRELGAFGELGQPVVAALDAIAEAAGERGVGLLADPTFVLELARRRDTVDNGTIGLLGEVLDHLRATAQLGPVLVGSRPTVAEAVAGYEAGALALRAPGTRASYRTWTLRLVAAHRADDVGAIGVAELAALIATHRGRGSQGGRCGEEMAIAAYRDLWSYLVAEGLAARNVASALRKPLRPEPLRRPIRADEAALVRSAARLGRDPLLDEVAVTLAERLGLRPVELHRLSLGDLDLAGAEMRVLGKGDRRRRLPLPPALAALLERFVDDRHGGARAPDARLFGDESVLVHGGDGQGVSRASLNRLFPRLARGMPELSASGGLSLYSYRHALASWVDPRFARAVTRRILGHSTRFSVTDQYVHAADEAVRDAISAYEEHLLAEFGP
jgi:integrase